MMISVFNAKVKMELGKLVVNNVMSRIISSIASNAKRVTYLLRNKVFVVNA